MNTNFWTMERIFNLSIQASEGVPKPLLKIKGASEKDIDVALKRFNIHIKSRRKKIWTDERIVQLKELCEIGFKSTDIADRMGLKPSQVLDAMSRFGIKNGRQLFTKGNTPWNKNKKGLTNKGNFKKGHKPHNALPIGTKQLRKNSNGYTYWRIKTEKGWKPLSSYIWEQEKGAIPKGYIITYLNSDPLDVRVENMALISRQEHLNRNRNYEKVSQSLKGNKNKASNKSIKKMYDPKIDIPWYLKRDPIRKTG